jgi:hypothetical protein
VSRVISLIVLAAAAGGMAYFGRGLRPLDTFGLLACGVVVGIALASIAARRR